MATLGERLKELRKRFKLTQGQLETYAGVSQSTISDLERGEIAPKTLTAIIYLAKYYNCSTDYLLGLTEDPTPTAHVAPVTHVAELVSISQQLTEVRRLELLRIAEALYELEQEAAAAQPTLLETMLERLNHGDTPRVIGAEPA